MKDFAQRLREQQRQIRKDFEALRRLYPECFGPNGKPLVAELRLPRIGSTK